MDRLDNHIAGGYFLVKSVERPDWMSADLMPPRILSLSDELCPSVHLRWAWDAETAREQFGIADIDAPDMRHWDSHADFEYPNVFLSQAAARQYNHESRLDTTSLHLLGAGLPLALLEIFLGGPYKQQVYDPRTSETSEVICGVGTTINRREALPPGGTPLGYEVLGYDQSIADSWLVSGLDRDMHELFGIRPNQYGLIDSLDAAMQVYDWIAEDEQRGHRAEPEPYYPWLLVEYPLLSD